MEFQEKGDVILEIENNCHMGENIEFDMSNSSMEVNVSTIYNQSASGDCRLLDLTSKEETYDLDNMSTSQSSSSATYFTGEDDEPFKQLLVMKKCKLSFDAVARDPGQFPNDENVNMVFCVGYTFQDYIRTAVDKGYVSDEEDESEAELTFYPASPSLQSEGNSSFESQKTVLTAPVSINDACEVDHQICDDTNGLPDAEIMDSSNLDENPQNCLSSDPAFSGTVDIANLKDLIGASELDGEALLHKFSDNDSVLAEDGSFSTTLESEFRFLDESVRAVEPNIEISEPMSPEEKKDCDSTIAINPDLMEEDGNISNESLTPSGNETDPVNGDDCNGLQVGETVDKTNPEIDPENCTNDVPVAEFVDIANLKDLIRNIELEDQALLNKFPDDESVLSECGSTSTTLEGQPGDQDTSVPANEPHVENSDPLSDEEGKDFVSDDDSPIDILDVSSFVDELIEDAMITSETMAAEEGDDEVFEAPDLKENPDAESDFWDQYMIIKSSVYQELVAWSDELKSLDENKEENDQQAAKKKKLLDKLEALLMSIDEPPNDKSKEQCLLQESSNKCPYSKEDIVQLRKAYKEKVYTPISYDKETLMRIRKCSLAKRQPSLDFEKADGVLKK